MRARWLVAVALAIPLLLGGCSVPPDGYVGIGRALDGSLWVYIRTCHHRMDGATLYWPDDPNGANSNEEVFARWEIARQPDPLRASWPLLGPGANGVTATKQLAEIPARPKNMAIGAGTRNNSRSAGGPYGFTAKTLAKLKPGQILTGNAPKNTAISMAEFDAIDCTQFPDG